MIIKFSNLGSIKETELDLRPLTIIIGPNNSNKTYVAYSIYGLLQTLTTQSFSLLREFTFKDEEDGSLSLRVDEKFKEKFTSDRHVKEREFKKNLEGFFQDSSRQLFSKTNIEIDITSEDIEQTFKHLTSYKKIEVGSLIFNFLSFEKHILRFRYEANNGEQNETYDKFNIAWLLSPLIQRVTYSRPFLLPAERNAFIITYKMLDNRRYKFLKQTQRGLFSSEGNEQRKLELLREQGDIRYPQPVEDFLDFLTDVELEQREHIDPRQKSDFQKLADEIEKHIQGNNRTNLRPTTFGGKEIKINVKRGLNIDLYNASSSIKQLAPLLLYLRHRASENDLLIIDEPEMNLHPESQAKLLEVLAVLVNLGVKVLLTTHSPYFMAHLNNLVNGAKNNQALKNQSSVLYLKDPRAFLSMDNVSAYEMKDSKLRTLKDEDYGIKWETLSDVSAELQQKYFQIFEKGKPTPRAKKK